MKTIALSFIIGIRAPRAVGFVVRGGSRLCAMQRQPRQAPAEVPAVHFESGLAWEAVQHPSATSPNHDKEGGKSARSRPSALVVGGSMGGCCAALALGELGCAVSLFERAPGELKTQGAGLVVQPDMADFLLHYGVVKNVVSALGGVAGRAIEIEASDAGICDHSAHWEAALNVGQTLQRLLH